MSIKITAGAIVALVLCCTTATAQMGIRYGIQYEKITRSTADNNMHLLLGFDYDLNRRMSGGVDLSTDMNWSQYGADYYSGSSGSSYSEKAKALGILYRSQFHLMDNNDGSAYLGPCVGLRFVTQRIVYYQTINSGWSTNTIEQHSTAHAVLVPLGLRVGYRGTLDGGYADIYFAVGTNLGGGRPISDLTFLGPESMAMTTFLQAGFTYGIGW